MEQNTVILSLEKYDMLKSFQAQLKEPKRKTIIIHRDFGYNYEVQTDDEAVEKLAQDLKKAKSELKKINNQLKFLLEKIKYMNWFELRKWKKKQNFILENLKNQ